MPLVVRAFPLRGSITDLQAFASELAGARAADTEQFYRHYGVDHESWHVQQTPNGPWVIAVTALANPAEAAPRYADARESFTFGSRIRSYLLLGSIRTRRLLALRPRRSFPGQAKRPNVRVSVVSPSL